MTAGAEKQARPHGELIRELLDSRIPKNEREHAAAREIERLRAEFDESCTTINKLTKLLAETAIVIKGPEPDMTKWSYHDIPDGVRAIQARAERLAELLEQAYGHVPAGALADQIHCALLRDQEEGLSYD